jgi:hypothetical protein
MANGYMAHGAGRLLSYRRNGSLLVVRGGSATQGRATREKPDLVYKRQNKSPE